jgi:ribonucleotide monophosphatase NagD (HAD superfamily)
MLLSATATLKPLSFSFHSSHRFFVSLAKSMTSTLPLPTILVDLSGTLHIGNEPTTPDAVDSLAKLRARGLPVRFVTNTTKESCQDLLTKVRGIGFNIREEEVCTS